MIMITFDGAVNHLNYDIYNKVFLENRTNPNGCPIRGTFFMTHDYSDYSKVQSLYSKGHEMAVASVTYVLNYTIRYLTERFGGFLCLVLFVYMFICKEVFGSCPGLIRVLLY